MGCWNSLLVGLLFCCVGGVRTLLPSPSGVVDVQGSGTPEPGRPSSQKLFNGKNLDGWWVQIGKRQMDPSEQSIFGVEDGVIRAYPSQVAGSKEPFAGLLTKRTYRDYHLSVEYRWGDKKFAPRTDSVRDAGILVHVFDPSDIWPKCVELQIQEGDTGDLWIIGTQASTKMSATTWGYDPRGKLATRPDSPAKRYSKFARSYCWERPGWNRVELIVRGDHAVFKVNGHTVNEAIDIKKFGDDGQVEPLASGQIMLQAEGAEIFYRNIELKGL